MAPIQTQRAHIFGMNAEQDGIDTHSAVWLYHNSPTTEVVAGEEATVWWGTGHHYANRDSYILWMIQPRTSSVGCGRMLNLHSHSKLPGSWFWGGGVSPIALDFVPTVQTDDKDTSAHYEGLTITAEPTASSIEGLQGTPHRYHWTVVNLATWNAAVTSGAWLSLVIKIHWGNINIPAGAGSLTCWLNGNDTPVVDAPGIDTHFVRDYRDDGSGNVPPQPPGGQEGIGLWSGGYVTPSNVYAAVEIGSYDYTLPRIGNTVAEALADGVSWPLTSAPQWTTHSTVGGSSSFAQSLTPVDSTQFQLPASLGGGGTPPPPPPPPVTLPVVAHWFGKQTVGTTQGTGLSIDARRGTAFQATTTMDLTDVYAILKGLGISSDTPLLRAVIYTMTGNPSTGGVPQTKIGESASRAFAGDLPRQWVDFPLNALTRVTSGSWYCIEFHCGGSPVMGLEYDATGGFFFFRSPDLYSDGADVVHGTPTSTDTRVLATFAAGNLVTSGNTYQWQRGDANGANWADIPGAISPAYKFVLADVGCTVRALVTPPGGPTAASSSTGVVY